MKKLKRCITVLISSIMILGLTACSTGSTNKEGVVQVGTETNSHYPVTITTYNYAKKPVEITFDKAPEKVVAVYQNSIETMLALGLEDKIVMASGLDHDVKDEYKDAFDKINYTEEFTPSKEAVVMEQPDFILSWYSLFDEKRLGDVDYWHDNDINTYMSLNSGASEDRTIENEVTDILNLGKIFNVEEKAQALVDKITTKVDKVISLDKDKEKQNVLIIEYMEKGIYTYGEKTLGGDMATKLGAKVLNPNGGYISEEDLVKLNPDTIFVVYMDKKDSDMATESVNSVLNNKSLSSLDAVKNKRVNAIELGEMYSSGIRTIDGINTFANGIYPNLEN